MRRTSRSMAAVLAIGLFGAILLPPVRAADTAYGYNSTLRVWDKGDGSHWNETIGLGSMSGTPTALALDANGSLVTAMGAQGSAVSSANSSTTPLAGAATFTGTSDAALGYEALTVIAYANQAGTLNIDQSIDGTNWDLTDSFSVSASTGQSVAARLVGSFYRVRYVNGGAAQATFRLQTIKHPVRASLPRTLSASGNLKVAVTESLPAGSNTLGAVTQASGPWSTNLTQVGGSALAFGQAAMAASVPVALASNQSTVNVTDTKTPSAAALGDTVSNPTTTLVGAPQMKWDGTQWQRVRFNSIWKFDATGSLTSNTNSTIWTPASGKKIRLMRLWIGCAQTGVPNIRVGAAGSGTTIWEGVILGNTTLQVDFGDGYLATADAVLEINNASGSGVVYYVTATGTEE